MERKTGTHDVELRVVKRTALAQSRYCLVVSTFLGEGFENELELVGRQSCRPE